MTSIATTKPKIFGILISIAIIVSITILLVTLRPWSEEAPAELKIGKTDGGSVTFIDSSTGEEVNIQVVDDDSGVAVDGIEVTYFDGEGYEVFITYDASNQYLPAIGIYEHNSDHVIETKRSGHGSYQIFAFEDEGTQKAARKWEHDNHMDWTYYEYVKTIDYEEKMEMQELLGKINDFLFNRILYFFSASSAISPSQIVEYLCPEPENPPQRYDIYNKTGKGYAGGLGFAIVTSNIPEVEITSLTVDDNEVSASWIGSDKDTYEDRVDLPSNIDLTKYVDGNDTHDLKYSYRITSGGQVYGGYDWTQYSSVTSVEVEIAEGGNYRFEVRVKDEVDNTGATSRDFEIETADIEEPPETTPSSVTSVWSSASSMNQPRSWHTATLLADGNVLVFGGLVRGRGVSGDGPVAEVFNPVTAKWSTLYSDIQSLDHLPYAEVIVLNDGKMMGVDFQSFEFWIFDPVSGMFSETKEMPRHIRGSALALNDGRVMFIGGVDKFGVDAKYVSPHIYDPRTGEWSSIEQMSAPHEHPTAVQLADGRVLVSGGNDKGGHWGGTPYAEIYDFSTGKWVWAGSMGPTCRESHTMTLLKDGRVLVVGGQGYSSDLPEFRTARIYDPSEDLWSPAGTLQASHNYHTATLLDDGRVLVTGGGTYLAEVYDPSTNEWSSAGEMEYAHTWHTATLMNDGRVLVAGGCHSITGDTISTVEIYSPNR